MTNVSEERDGESFLSVSVLLSFYCDGFIVCVEGNM